MSRLTPDLLQKGGFSIVLSLRTVTARNRKHTALRLFYAGTRTVPFGLVVQYLTVVTNTDVYLGSLPAVSFKLRRLRSFCGNCYFHSPPNVCTHNNLTTKYKQLRRSPQKVTGSEFNVYRIDPFNLLP